MNWIVLIIAVSLIPGEYNIKGIAIIKSFLKVKTYVYSELKGNLQERQRPLGSLWPLLSLFILVALTNTSGLLPYVFPGSSHLVFTVAISLPLWLGYIVNSWASITNHILAHLVPLSTPTPLLPFMVLVELVRSIIRPLTLAVRLAANIVAGHLLLVLLRSVISVKRSLFILIGIMVIIVILVLSVLESAVSLIQAYVFVALQRLYLREVSSEAAKIWE